MSDSGHRSADDDGGRRGRANEIVEEEEALGVALVKNPSDPGDPEGKLVLGVRCRQAQQRKDQLREAKCQRTSGPNATGGIGNDSIDDGSGAAAASGRRQVHHEAADQQHQQHHQQQQQRRRRWSRGGRSVGLNADWSIVGSRPEFDTAGGREEVEEEGLVGLGSEAAGSEGRRASVSRSEIDRLSEPRVFLPRPIKPPVCVPVRVAKCFCTVDILDE